METYSCIIFGTETFRLVSPLFKQNMYSGYQDELDPAQSPVDLFYENVTDNLLTFPLLKETPVYEVTLNKGECLFIPAWWWM